ncbi:universal stress protein [Streptomyces sp. NPDC002888]|uniref:universal stress protein n=1 Tax=Streptomyces sp. NPDC002888 TaxID=3364668 RepID=UPI0036AB9FC6
MYPNDGFRELDRQECLRLLANAPLGRIVHTRQALPAVLPVDFRLDDDGAVLLRAAVGPELVRALRVRRSTVEGPARRVLLHRSAAADLLIIGARHRHGHYGLQLGRVAHTLLHHAECPVAVVPQRV